MPESSFPKGIFFLLFTVFCFSFSARSLFADSDRITKRFRDEVAPKVAADQAYLNAKRNTPNTARIEHDKALGNIMLGFLKDDTEVYKQFVQNDSFRRFVADMIYNMTMG